MSEEAFPAAETIDTIFKIKPQGTVVEVQFHGEQMALKVHEPGYLEEMAKDTSKVHCTILELRAGGRYFTRYLELKHFNPYDQEASALFELRMVRWNDLFWNIVSIPAEKLPCFYDAAEKASLQLVQGVPMMFEIENGGVETKRFPLSNDNCYTIENLPGSPVYSHLEGHQQALLAEDARLVVLEKQFPQNHA